MFKKILIVCALIPTIALSMAVKDKAKKDTTLRAILNCLPDIFNKDLKKDFAYWVIANRVHEIECIAELDNLHKELLTIDNECKTYELGKETSDVPFNLIEFDKQLSVDDAHQYLSIIERTKKISPIDELIADKIYDLLWGKLF